MALMPAARRRRLTTSSSAVKRTVASVSIWPTVYVRRVAREQSVTGRAVATVGHEETLTNVSFNDAQGKPLSGLVTVQIGA
jgi:hypothetical protein